MASLVIPAAPADIDHEVLVLIHHKNTVRDCWFETNSDGEKYLVLRQVGFGEDGGNGTITKQFRLRREEFHALFHMLRRELEKEQDHG